MVVHGTGGTLRAGARVAAVLGSWRVVKTDSAPAFAIDCEMRQTDTFGLTQRPLAIWLPIGQRWWIWEIVDLVGDTPARLQAKVSGAPRIA